MNKNNYIKIIFFCILGFLINIYYCKRGFSTVLSSFCPGLERVGTGWNGIEYSGPSGPSGPGIL